MSFQQVQDISLKWVDNHCHIENSDEGREEIESAKNVGVKKLINVFRPPKCKSLRIKNIVGKIIKEGISGINGLAILN